ncbi:MAG: hypothetical protein AAGF01_04490 [Cyanobacteria bacterium P01_G01_bin.38]
MRHRAVVRQQVLWFLILIFALHSLAMTLALVVSAPDSLTDMLALLSLVLYTLTLLPSILRTFLKYDWWLVSSFRLELRHQVLILKRNRRTHGVAAYSLGLSHASLSLMLGGQNPLNLATYLHYWHGSCLLVIFTLLALTSNDWSVRALGKNWQRLHRLTYVALPLLIVHILGNVGARWHWSEVGALSLTTALILLMAQRSWLICKAPKPNRVNRVSASQSAHPLTQPTRRSTQNTTAQSQSVRTKL